jgi:hypothetical protein
VSRSRTKAIAQVHIRKELALRARQAERYRRGCAAMVIQVSRRRSALEASRLVFSVIMP